MRPVVFLNGPPRSGKDTLAGHITTILREFREVKFAAVLKERTHALYGVPELPHQAFEYNKDVPNEVFLGLTPRQAYINVSEILLKPLHGQRVFGDMLLKKMIKQESAQAFVISDSGFVEEAGVIIEHFGAENCLLVQIHAEKRGKSFAGDSRSYIELPIKTIKIQNNGAKADFLPEANRKLADTLQAMISGV